MNMTSKKVYVVTGTRADYGIYTPILEKLREHPKYTLKLIVTGMHLSPTYGNTINEIKKDGYEIATTVDCLLQGSTESNMAKSIALGILGITQFLEQDTPDILMILGDRGEMLAAAIAASHMNIPVCHLHGGEISGSIDESVRHAISKLSHIHFPSTHKSAERLIKMGEDSWRVFPVGAPRLDTILSTKLPSIEEIKEKYGLLTINPNDYILLVFHPVTTDINDVSQQIRSILDALLKRGTSIICILPNSDAGTEHIINTYNEYKENPNINFVTNFSHLDYLSVLKHSRALVGNSSSGIIEAASYKIPVLNIGNRQNGRERSENILDVNGVYAEIEDGLEQVLSEQFSQSIQHLTNVYGNGTASDKILNILEKLDLNDPNLIRKVLAY